MTSIEQVVASFLASVVAHAYVADPARAVSGIRIHDPERDPADLAGLLVLAVGLDRGADLTGLVHDLAATAAGLPALDHGRAPTAGGLPALDHGLPAAAAGPPGLVHGRAATAAGLVAKCRDAERADVAAAARRAGLNVIIIDADADWLQAMALLQAGIASAGGPALTDGVQDLFELADVAADAVGGPVTIEDDAGNLVAYSRDQEGGDQVRVQTLIARRSPPGFTRALAERGIPQRLLGSGRPLVVTGVQAGVADRLAIALRAGAFPLGSMWVLVSDPSPEQAQALTDIAAHVALHLMKRRSESGLARRVELEELALLLHGGAGVTGGPAATRLGAGTHWVAALDIAEVDPTARAVVRARVEQRLSLVPSAGGITFLAGQMSNLLFLIVTATTETAAVRQWLTDLLSERGGALLPVYAGIGRAAASAAELPRSRREAERALSVARAEPHPAPPVSFDDCWARASLQRALDPALIADLENLTPLWRLREHDREHATDYLPSLAAWLRCQGNIRLAAAELHIHANTLRYRMEKLAAVAGVDLDDPDTRLILSLQLWPV